MVSGRRWVTLGLAWPPLEKITCYPPLHVIKDFFNRRQTTRARALRLWADSGRISLPGVLTAPS
jgi:hypothetical protein